MLAAGYRVRGPRGTQFRQWAAARLSEYLVKGFTMDNERLKNPPGEGQKDYFDELLERIRDIRSWERRFYQKVLDIYATSVDYTPDAEASQRFFATVHNKMHWATHGRAAAEIIHERSDAKQPIMDLQTTPPGGIVRKDDATVAKSYPNEDEMKVLNHIVNLYIKYAELQALERRQMMLLGMIELKNPADQSADVWKAYGQVQTYKDEIGDLLVYNEALVVSDGMNARVGTLAASQEWFMPWRTIANEHDQPQLEFELEKEVRGFFRPDLFWNTSVISCSSSRTTTR